MNILQEYLNKNHKTSEYVKEDFRKEFGVNVRQEDDLFLFKYGIISVRWDNEITRECRGAILRHSEPSWECLSRPWSKFFNQHEGHCPIFKEDAFNGALNESVLVEKVDGTCIQLWYDGKRWRASTLGTITPHTVQDSVVTFDQLFFDTIGDMDYSKLDTSCTYLFELCCDENRIVTKYSENHAVLLGVRNRISGDFLEITELNYIFCNGFQENNIRLPTVVNPDWHGLKNLDDVKGFVETQSQSEKYGKWPEGFVLYNASPFYPVAKMKNMRYKSLHSFGGGDIGHSKNSIINAIFLNYLDDVYDMLSDRLKVFANEVKSKASKLHESQQGMIQALRETSLDTRKNYALFIKEKADSKLQGFFFQNANKFMNNDFDVSFDVWLKLNYLKFDWKCDE